MYWQQIAEYELHQEDEVDETEPVPNAAEINAAREWLDIDDDDSPQSSKDILKIIKTCLKAVKKLKTGRTIKMMTACSNHRICEASSSLSNLSQMQQAMLECQHRNCETDGERWIFCTSDPPK
jgi:hypothetical protein